MCDPFVQGGTLEYLDVEKPVQISLLSPRGGSIVFNSEASIYRAELKSSSNIHFKKNTCIDSLILTDNGVLNIASTSVVNVKTSFSWEGDGNSGITSTDSAVGGSLNFRENCTSQVVATGTQYVQFVNVSNFGYMEFVTETGVQLMSSAKWTNHVGATINFGTDTSNIVLGTPGYSSDFYNYGTIYIYTVSPFTFSYALVCDILITVESMEASTTMEASTCSVLERMCMDQ